VRKLIAFSTLLISFCQLSAQKQRLVNVYLQGQLNWPRYDISKVNNNAGFGLGAQAFLHTKSKFNATLELTADKYWGKKVLLGYRTSPFGAIPSVDGMVSLFAGTTWNPSKIFYMGIAAGPSFINGNVHAGFKPAIGLFSRNQRWTTRLSFIHLVNRYMRTKDDFGAASFSIGYRVH
jgi:hypothetical protein